MRFEILIGFLFSLSCFYIWLFLRFWRSFSHSRPSLPLLERVLRTSLSVVLAPIIPLLMGAAAVGDRLRRR